MIFFSWKNQLSAEDLDFWGGKKKRVLEKQKTPKKRKTFYLNFPGSLKR